MQQLKLKKISFTPNSHHVGVCLRASITPTPTFKVLDVQIFSESLSYIQKFKGKTIVVKYGGAAMKSVDLKASVVKDLIHFSRVGIHPILAHGGGPKINIFLNHLNIPSKFYDGLCVTYARTVEVVYEVLVGKVNKDLVSCIKFGGATAVGLSDMDGTLLITRPIPNAAHIWFIREVAGVDPNKTQSSQSQEM